MYINSKKYINNQKKKKKSAEAVSGSSGKIIKHTMLST